jgi:cytochrome c553
MDQHFAEVALVEQAVIRSNLEAAQGPARSIYEHQEIGGFPEARHLALMKSAAKAVAEAAKLNRAAEATGSMLVSCGTCHTEVGARPKMPDAPEPPAGSGTAPHMLEHQWAADMMERGLVGPSDELWTKGAERLKAAPLTANELPKDPKLTKEIIAFEASVHALAEKARQTPDPGGRAHVYGEILSSCGHCHSLHGQVWGPGLPKG